MTTAPLPVRDPAALSAALREGNLPGQRSKTAITRLRRLRGQRRPLSGFREPDVAARAIAHMTALYCAEIQRRGGETGIDAENSIMSLRITDRAQGLTVLHAYG